MDKQAGTFRLCLRLAITNLKNGRSTTLPYLVAVGVISGAYLLIAGLMFSKTLVNLPSGDTAAAIFLLGLIVFSVFTVLFMLYLNRFLVSRRTKEFALYAVLGLEKRHVGLVLLLENGLLLLGGMLMGAAMAMLLGRLVFYLLVRIIRSVPGSTFSLPGRAFLLTAGLFFLVYLLTSAANLISLRGAGPLVLMQKERAGEKETRFSLPLTIVGLVALLISYSLALTIEEPLVAMFLFFGLVILVIFATYVLFSAGSVTVLDALKGTKGFYYQPEHFVTVSGLKQRLRQHAKSLATITILCCMLIVSVSGTLALYLGQEEMLSGMYPYDVSVNLAGAPSDAVVADFEQTILRLADENGVALAADPAKLSSVPPADDRLLRNNYCPEGMRLVPLQQLIYFDGGYRFDATGDPESCIAFCSAVRAAVKERFPETERLIVSEVFSAREDGYGLYGGLLFLGAFFGILFLAVTVLLIYFKQITEGSEDRERFVILQKVGMDDALVKKTIDRQIVVLFFLPLGVSALHMLFASKIMARMLESLMLFDWGLVLGCIGGTLVLFALIYYAVFRLTARTYYRLIRR